MKLSRFLICVGAFAGISAVCGALLVQRHRRQQELFDFMDKEEQKSLEMTVPEKREPGLYLAFENYTNEMIEDLKKLGMEVLKEAETLEVKWNGKRRFAVSYFTRQVKRLARKYHAKLASLEYIGQNS